MKIRPALTGRQPLYNVAVTCTALGARTHFRGLPGLGMLPSGYPSVESVLPGTREGLDLHEASRPAQGLFHTLWNCVGASKMWTYIITQWTRTEVSSAQIVLYKQAALSQSLI